MFLMRLDNEFFVTVFSVGANVMFAVGSLKC